MTGLVDWATGRARMIVALVILSLAAGGYAYVNLPKEGEPDIEIPALFVSVPFPGISAEDAEKLLVRPLETLGLIIDPQAQYDYLAQVLPNWARTMPSSYRVEMRLNGDLARVLRAGEGRDAPTLVFDFRDSAIDADVDDAFSSRRPAP